MGKNQSKTNQVYTSNFLKTKPEKNQLPSIKRYPKGKRHSCENIQVVMTSNNYGDPNLDNFKLDDEVPRQREKEVKFKNSKDNVLNTESSKVNSSIKPSSNKNVVVNLSQSTNMPSKVFSSSQVVTVTSTPGYIKQKVVSKISDNNVVAPTIKRNKYNSIKELPVISNGMIESNVDSKYETDKYKNLTDKYNKNANTRSQVASSKKGDKEAEEENSSDLEDDENYIASNTNKRKVPVSKVSTNEVISITTLNDLSRFNLIKVIGKGTFGKVILVTLKEDPNHLFALKILKKEHLVSTKNVRNIINERKLLSEINSNFVVKLRFTFQSNEKLFMAFDYHNGGELFYHLQKKKRFTEDEVRVYAAEIYLALAYLHTKGIVYRDIKPENIILDKTGHIKLVDFGLAKKLSSNNLYTSSFCGTNEYIRKCLFNIFTAPEVLLGNQYSFNFDWWGFGIIIYEMLHGIVRHVYYLIYIAAFY